MSDRLYTLHPPGSRELWPRLEAEAERDPVWSRRVFLQMLGGAAALATVGGCDRTPPDRIMPYSRRPRGTRPGVPRWYATSMVLDGFATGLLVESHDGRPTKVEGNPEHPSSLGGAGLWEQAHVLSVYDPDRARSPRRGRRVASWDELLSSLAGRRVDRGAGLRILAEPTSSPTELRLMQVVKREHPACKIVFHSPVAPLQNAVLGARLAFGRPLQPVHDLSKADVALLLDADPLGTGLLRLRDARGWASKRRVAHPTDAMSRVYAVECAPTVTGMSADHRLRARPSHIAGIAQAVEKGLTSGGDPAGSEGRFVAAVARDLAKRPSGTTLVLVGERQPPAVHALGIRMNAALGNLGHALAFIEPVVADGDTDLSTLCEEMRAGQVDTLVILGGNPAYTAPADLDFAGALARVPTSFYLGAYEDETARQVTAFGPAAHPLESWGDARAYDGTLAFVQPLIRPLTGGRSTIEVLAALVGSAHPEGHALLRETHHELDLDEALRRGLVPGTAAAMVSPPALREAEIGRALATLSESSPQALELCFAPSSTIYDGRFANNPWLLEQPDPVTKLTWENAVLIAPATAARRSLRSEDVIELELDGRRVRGAALVVPGHAEDAVTLCLGWGRTGAESLARGRGFDAYCLRSRRAPGFAGGGSLRRVEGHARLAITQSHFSLEGRPIALQTTLAEYRQHPELAPELRAPQPSLMPPVPREGPQWAMSIDLALCTGCSACMLGCQSENNVLVVGKQGVLDRREMSWLRIDTYFAGAPDDPVAVHQPMLCQHCETAPCEYVCPVNATVHSADGLNEMVYNRCVGTRFCSNNCPYKVRRFNWFNWSKRVEANQGTYELVRNPDVTVRARGVMEKCTYCVQRIREAEIGAELAHRKLRPDEVKTACQQACPTGAIEFGSLEHQDTPMVRWRNEPRAYGALADQGTRPRTLYLARLRNPNPESGG